MKKILVVLMMLLIASTVFANGSKDLIPIGIIGLLPSESGYREANVKDMAAVFNEKTGYKVYSSNYATHNEQLNGARVMIDSGVKYLLISPASITGWDPILAEAKRAGIPVFVYDRMINTAQDNFTAAVVSDMQNQGRNAVAWMEAQDRHKAEGYKIIHIQGQIGSAAQIGRTQPLDAAIAKHANWTLVRRGTGGDSWSADEAKRIVAAAIAANQDFNIIYAENDGMAEGAMKALQEAGITHGKNGKVWIMGFDYNKFALRYVLSGDWNFNGQCSPFQASIIDGFIKQMEKGEKPNIPANSWTEYGRTYTNVVVNPERTVDNKTITAAYINQYGLGN